MEELHNVIALVSTEARKRNIRLELKPTLLPHMDGDPEKLRQAFLNIILNGLQATESGGNVTITVFHEEANDNGTGWLDLSFSDTGHGIDSDTLERIFEPFYTSKEGGTGLGLAITRKIVESHGGHIEVKSRSGEGTDFRIRLPLKLIERGK
jgi:signal transduction histidine kinase